MEESATASSPQKSPLGWIAFVVIVLVLGAAGFTAVRNNPNSNNQNPTQAQNPSPTVPIGAPLSPHTLVYGSWSGSNSEITALDLSTRKYSTLASLPVTIKKVSVMSPTTLLYIDGTDRRDHGKRLVLYDVKNKKETAKIPSDNGFGIDDYVVSPNKKFVAVWEVSFAEGSEVLQGGRSRVYAVDVSNPSIKRLLYDEVANGPIHYPRAILNNGKVFADKFTPNDPSGGAGWAYGVSVVSFDGSGKEDLSQMQHGTYGTQPSLSPDGRNLLFAGYDGSRGPGTVVKNGYRQAVLTPNTVELLDTNTLERKKLPNLPNNNIYSSPDWDRSTSSIVISQLSQNADQSGLYSYNLASNVATKINLPVAQQAEYLFLSRLSTDKLLIATIEDSSSSLGNLGNGYANLIKQLYLLNTDTNDAASLQFNSGLVQYITTLPQSYFQSVLGIAHAQGGNPVDPNVTIIDLYSDKPSQENLQLKTFLMKPELAPVREEQQTEQPTPTPRRGITPPPPTKDGLPKCADLARQQCAEIGSTDIRCQVQKRADGLLSGACYDSPLYLYGTAGNKVSVKVQTPVYNDNPTYSDGYNITLQNGGKMQINGQVYEAINYDYRSNLRRITPPTKGVVVSKTGVEKTLREYAKKLGLNEKETADLVEVGKKRVTTPYVFVSFFDHETSNSILPLTFAPQPDNYLNVVFYFKLLNEKPNYSPIPPDFGSPLNRSGLTAVEVSEIVE